MPPSTRRPAVPRLPAARRLHTIVDDRLAAQVQGGKA